METQFTGIKDDFMKMDYPIVQCKPIFFPKDASLETNLLKELVIGFLLTPPPPVAETELTTENPLLVAIH